MHIPFDNTYAALPSGFYTAQPPTAVKAPSLLAFNAALAARRSGANKVPCRVPC